MKRLLYRLTFRYGICRVIGHQLSAVEGVALGFNWPVCLRCGRQEEQP